MESEEKRELIEQEKAIFSALEVIDVLMADENVKLNTRPLRAAIHFVQDFIVEVSDGSKESFADQGWFAVVFHHVKDWYRQTYGTLMNENRDGFGRGVVSIKRLPVALKVPFTRSIVEEEGKTSWLCFPASIEDNENPVSWLIDPPPLKNLKQTDLNKLDIVCARTTVALRNINLNLQGVSDPSEVLKGLIDGILSEIEAAAGHILTNQSSSFGLAAWSIQMALERALKALALQKSGSFKETHDLFTLFDLASLDKNQTKRDVMKSFLRVDKVMDARYGQGDSVDREHIFKSFLVCIELIATISQDFERDITISGARLLLKKPPWVSLPE